MTLVCWTCPTCGYRLTSSRPIVFPLVCRCRGVFRDGDVVEQLNAPTPCRPTSVPLNLGRSVAAWVAAGSPVRDDVESERLLAICRDCSHFAGDSCNLCRCFVVSPTQATTLAGRLRPAFLNKIRMATERCPAGKW